jgi:hypothetical protein
MASGSIGHVLGISDLKKGITKNMGKPLKFFFSAALTFPL